MHASVRQRGRVLLPGALLLATHLCSWAAAEVIVAYETGAADREEVDIAAQLLLPDGTLGWGGSTEPVLVAAFPHIETAPVVVADGAGGAFVIFEVQFTEGEHQGDRDIAAQRIGADGKLLWNDGETPVLLATSEAAETKPVAMSDGAGGFIVTYEWTDEGGDTDILAQRLDGEGRLLWMRGDAPAVVAASSSPERDPVMVPDGEGGAIILFEWHAPEGNVDVMAQRISAEGKALWNAGEQAVDVSASGASERAIAAVPDGEGGALVAFEFEYLEGEYKGDVDIMAQRVTGDGAVMWNTTDDPVTVSSANGIEGKPFAVTDGAGGMIVTFEYEPLEGEYAGDTDAMAQRIGPDGTLLWNGGERSVGVSSAPGLERAVQAVALPDGSAIVVLEHEFRGGEHAGDIDIIAQGLSASGELLWNEGERSAVVSASRWLERFPIALPDGEGGAIVVFPMIGAEGEWEGDEDIGAARLSGDGDLLWLGGEESVQVAGSALLERHPSAAVVSGQARGTGER